MITLQKISKTFQNQNLSVEAIRDISLTVHEGEFVAILGPSGSGKTTLLRIVAGLEKPSNGAVLINNQSVSNPGSDRGIVFQEYSLFPWLTARENIAFGLQMKNFSEPTAEKVVQKYLEITKLSDVADLYPVQLSGGMQQRVALARTLVNKPKVLLMDEPFGSLDAHTRSKMQDYLLEVWSKDRKTILFATHDIKEALFLADRVVVLSERPATIKAIIDVRFGRPRSHELKTSAEFFEQEAKVAKLLEV